MCMRPRCRLRTAQAILRTSVLLGGTVVESREGAVIGAGRAATLVLSRESSLWHRSEVRVGLKVQCSVFTY